MREDEELSETLSVAPGDPQKSLRAEGVIFKQGRPDEPNESRKVEIAVTGTVVTKKAIRKFRGECLKDESQN